MVAGNNVTTEFYPGQLLKVVLPFTVTTSSNQSATLYRDVCLFLGATHKRSYAYPGGYDITYLLSSDGLVYYTEWWDGLFCDGSECYVEPFSHKNEVIVKPVL